MEESEVDKRKEGKKYSSQRVYKDWRNVVKPLGSA